MENKRLFCSQCWTELPEGVAACPVCGRSVTMEPEQAPAPAKEMKPQVLNSPPAPGSRRLPYRMLAAAALILVVAVVFIKPTQVTVSGDKLAKEVPELSPAGRQLLEGVRADFGSDKQTLMSEVAGTWWETNGYLRVDLAESEGHIRGTEYLLKGPDALTASVNMIQGPKGWLEGAATSGSRVIPAIMWLSEDKQYLHIMAVGPNNKIGEIRAVRTPPSGSPSVSPEDRNAYFKAESEEMERERERRLTPEQLGEWRALQLRQWRDRVSKKRSKE